jgi:hypothetical protein
VLARAARWRLPTTVALLDLSNLSPQIASHSATLSLLPATCVTLVQNAASDPSRIFAHAGKRHSDVTVTPSEMTVPDRETTTVRALGHGNVACLLAPTVSDASARPLAERHRCVGAGSIPVTSPRTTDGQLHPYALPYVARKQRLATRLQNGHWECRNG